LVGDAVYDVGKDILKNCDEEPVASASPVKFQLQGEDEGAHRNKENYILSELPAGVDLMRGAAEDHCSSTS
jgi:hypothetical protein